MRKQHTRDLRTRSGAARAPNMRCADSSATPPGGASSGGSEAIASSASVACPGPKPPPTGMPARARPRASRASPRSASCIGNVVRAARGSGEWGTRAARRARPRRRHETPQSAACRSRRRRPVPAATSCGTSRARGRARRDLRAAQWQCRRPARKPQQRVRERHELVGGARAHRGATRHPQSGSRARDHARAQPTVTAELAHAHADAD